MNEVSTNPPTNQPKEKQDDWVLCAAPLTAEESFEAVNTYLKEKEKQDESNRQ